MGSFFGEFKKFISKGNVVDMAVGVVVGSAFTKIVNSVVADIISPFVSLLLGDVNFADVKAVLVEATETTPEIAITYGNLVQAVLSFLIVAFCLFCVVRVINKVKDNLEKDEKERLAAIAKAKAEEEKLAAEKAEAERLAEEERLAAIPTREELLLQEIRDLLKAEKK